MKVKVCGMREEDNLRSLIKLNPDFIGFIFYSKSPRNVKGSLNETFIKSIPPSIKKVGVFVNSDFREIKDKIQKFDLDYAQLHGQESPELCSSLQMQNIGVIKAFQVNKHFDFSITKKYENKVDYFLFDTKLAGAAGGHGVAFDWSLLRKYEGVKPYFLAGGISLENVNSISSVKPQPFALDVNSQFEISPGLKDINRLEKLIAITKLTR